MSMSRQEGALRCESAQSEAPNPLDAQVLLGVAVVAQAAHALVEIQSGRTLRRRPWETG